ncbi:MAG: PAS domain S-box protein [Candidatus Zixiibacteriota bacterium]
MSNVGGNIDKDMIVQRWESTHEVRIPHNSLDLKSRPLLFRAAALILLSIFIIETVLIRLLSVLPFANEWHKSLLDASLVSLCVLPILYFIVVLKPLKAEFGRRQLAETALRDSESRYRNLYQSTPAMLHSIDGRGRLLRVSDYWLDKMGYNLDEVIGHKSTEFLTPESAKYAREVVLPEFMRRGECRNVPYRFVKKNGTTMNVHLSAISERYKDGTVLRSMAVIEDLTERNRSERAMIETQKCLDTALQCAKIVVSQVDTDLRYAWVSHPPPDFKIENVIGKRDDELLPPESAAGIMSLKREALETRSTVKEQVRLSLSEGTRIFEMIVEPSIDTGGKVNGLITAGFDITENVQADERKIRAARLDSILLRMYGESVSLPDHEFCAYALDQAVALTKSSIGFFHRISEDQKEINLTAWNREAQENCTAAYDTHYPVEKAGNWVDCIRSRRPVIYNDFSNSPNQKGLPAGHAPVRRFLSVPVLEGEKVILVFGVGNKEEEYDELDGTHLQLLAVELNKILRQRESEHRLKTSEDRFRAISENSLAGIWIVQDGLIKYTNPILSKLLEFTEVELAGTDPLPHFHPDDQPALQQLVTKCCCGSCPACHVEIRAISRTGIELDFEGAASYIEWDGRCAVLFNLLNITETKRLRELEARAQRLETVGRIAGQVAHDFNNLLGPVMAYPELIRDEISGNENVYEYLSAIETAAHQIAAINQDLLTLGRRGHYSVEPMNLNSIIKESLKELEPLPETVICEAEYCPELLRVRGGVAQMRRAFSNLLHNAEDALNGVGTISVRTENFYADDVIVGYGRVPSGEYVRITISDTGIGIPDDIVQKIFEPFFSMTTADRKRGSGLGLSVVDAVIKDHRGFIDLSSKVGQGTSFYLYLPANREQETVEEFEETRGGSEYILIVDDDAVQREVVARILSKLGYKTACAASGEQAIESLMQTPADLLVLDMIMPGGLDGAETFRRTLEINPKQKAIIVSGFSESDRANEAKLLGAGTFVKKPLTVRAIAAAVRKELDTAARAPAGLRSG